MAVSTFGRGRQAPLGGWSRHYPKPCLCWCLLCSRYLLCSRCNWQFQFSGGDRAPLNIACTVACRKHHEGHHVAV
jgi:hypothetical protein